MRDPQPHDKNAALKVTISASVSLAIMIAEFLWLIRDEAKYVWPRLRKSWISRIYVLTRYVGLASQIFNVYFAVRMYLGIYTSPSGCHVWFLFQAGIVQFLLVFVEGLLMHRIYALFLYNRLILVVLLSFAVGQTVSMGVSAGLSYPSNKHTVTCLLMKSNPGNAYFCATTMTTNVIIFFMSFWRYFRLPARWTQQGLGRVVLRDSALSLSAISVMMLFLMLCSLQVIKPTMSGNITYYWLVCILWASIGRIIVNHEKIQRDDGEQGEDNTWKGTLQLTSQIELGQSELSLDTQCGSSDWSTPASNTLERSLSTPMTKASQLAPSTVRTSDSVPKELGDHSLIRGHGQGYSPRPSSMDLSVEASIPNMSRLSLPTMDNGDSPQPSITASPVEVPASNASHSRLPNACTSDRDAPRTEDRPQSDADVDADGRVPSPSPAVQPSSPEPPPLQAPS